MLNIYVSSLLKVLLLNIMDMGPRITKNILPGLHTMQRPLESRIASPVSGSTLINRAG